MIEQSVIRNIRELSEKLETKEDLLDLLNFAREKLFGQLVKPIHLKSLTFYSQPVLSRNRYRIFLVKKKSGKDRKIHAPAKSLKIIQSSLNLVLQCLFEPHPAATGFIHDKSIASNAGVHTNMHYVYNIDLKDFFHSVDLHRVKACFKLSPFNLNGDKEPIAFLLANLCCEVLPVNRLTANGEWEVKKLPVLPQGAPTSPTITNIVSKNMDSLLSRHAKKHGAKYTRYADDITFSSMHNIYQEDSTFIKELYEIIKKQNFHINFDKVRLQSSEYRQEVTGLTVNEKVNVHRKYLQELRMWIYYWERYGVIKAAKLFEKDSIRNGYPGRNRKDLPPFKCVIEGKLNYLKMIKGADDATYKKLLKRFQKLKSCRNEDTDSLHLEHILHNLATDGLEQAMELYLSKN